MSELFIKLVNLWADKSLDIIISSYYSFLTIWCIFFQILYYIGILKKFQFSIFLLTLIVSIIGFFITYIHPNKFVIPIINFEIKGIYTKILDLIFHHIPLVILSIVYNKNIPKDNTYFLWIILMFYLLLNNPFNNYYLY